MSDITKTKSAEVVLTQAQFTAMQTAGTLQEGVAYHISDYQEPVQSVDGETGAVVLSDVKYTSQSLTDAQKTQARTNISAITLEEYDSTATPVDGILYYTTE